eukprot:gene48045-65465_t
MWSRAAPRAAPPPLPLRWVPRGERVDLPRPVAAPCTWLTSDRCGRRRRRRCYHCGAYGHVDRGGLCPDQARMARRATTSPVAALAVPPPRPPPLLPRSFHQSLPIRAADWEGAAVSRRGSPLRHALQYALLTAELYVTAAGPVAPGRAIAAAGRVVGR